MQVRARRRHRRHLITVDQPRGRPRRRPCSTACRWRGGADYTLLTIGDGLVAQIPALIISTAAGIVVTRSASGGELGLEITKQLLWNPKALGVVAAILALFIVVPGFPAIPFFLAAAAARRSRRSRFEQDDARAKKTRGRDQTIGGKSPKSRCGLSRWIWSKLEVGYELIPLVDGERGAVVERIRALRRQFVTDRGFLVPQIHIRDNLRLGSKQYVILVKGIEAGKGELKPARLLAMNATGAAHNEGALIGEADPGTGVWFAGAVDLDGRP